MAAGTLTRGRCAARLAQPSPVGSPGEERAESAIDRVNHPWLRRFAAQHDDEELRLAFRTQVGHLHEVKH